MSFILKCLSSLVIRVFGAHTQVPMAGVPSLERSELQTACEDFSNVIDSLSDCTLYKGTLSSGVEIAVTSTMIKAAKDWSDESEALFRNKAS